MLSARATVARMSRSRVAIGAFLAVSALTLAAAAPSVARAQPPSDQARKDEARALAMRGDEELEGKKFPEAERTFTKALELIDAPTLRVRLARALVGQERLVAARLQYAKVVALELGVDAPAPFVEAVAEARSELAALDQRIPIIRVGRVAGRADVIARVDDTPAKPGEEVRVDPGRHSVSADGAAPRDVDVAEGEKLTVDLVEDSVPFPWRTTSTPVFILAGIGLLGLGIGTGFGIDAIAQKRDLDAACPTGRCAPALASLHDDYITSSIVSTTAIAIGGAAIVTGVIVFAVGKPLGADDTGEEPPKSGDASVAIGPTGASARVLW